MVTAVSQYKGINDQRRLDRFCLDSHESPKGYWNQGYYQQDEAILFLLGSL